MPAGRHGDLHKRDLAWYQDKGIAAFVFVGGISAIVFILGIFVFITKEGMGFILNTMDVKEFFTSTAWRPTFERAPTYGALALIVGTASVTGLAMLVSVPLLPGGGHLHR